MGTPNLAAIYADVETGLASQQHRLNDAAMAQAFYDYLGKRFMQVFLRDAETPFDYVQRPYRMSGIVRQVTEILSEHLYSPGPSRTWSDSAGDEFLKQVYEQNHFDALMCRCDEMSTLNDLAAIQVDADAGDWSKPITLRPWGAQDFHVWTDPDNRTIPAVCCTIDRYETETWYRVWTDKDVARYRTDKNELMKGDRAAVYVDTEPHDYGCLPFEFVHYVQPVTTFWESGIGTMLCQAEIRVNDRLSRLDESINKHLNPLPVAENVQDDWHPILEPQRFLKLSNSKLIPGATGGYETGPAPRLYYLEAHIDTAGAWDDLLKYLNQVMRACKIPITFFRGEDVGMASGLALVVEQAPLLTRARKRRRPFGVYETAIARCVLRCAGNHYGKRNLVASSKSGSMALGWPQPSVPVPTQDNLDLLVGQVTVGIKSLVMAAQEWYGVDREQALQLLEQVELDNTELAQRAPTLAPQRNAPAAEGDDAEEVDDETEGDDAPADNEDNESRGLKEAIVDL
jgi:Phage portal protein, SPP1 Gp6-like